MADNKPQETPQQEASLAISEATAEAEKLQLDEAKPGHHYIVNGQKVTADGQPLKDSK